ncbi:hydroxyacyl-thioester dehydratase type 2, mitochondrial-like [Tubulanus polymorphus]|uniref:hydroxyacyl-thioester dehydratase type 2, mitochondrial-like n=1 Tax=Tubulanus polymorphus TaxID=672921 RepID=UPI003DA68302
MLRIIRNYCPLNNSSVTRRNLHIFTGQKAEMTKCFTRDEVKLFASITEDTNPIHLDEDFARKTRFGKCIVHGVLINGLISALLGTKLPGVGSIFVSQETEFSQPLFIGETITASVEVVNIKNRTVTCSARCIVPESNKIVMSGSVKLLVPREKVSPLKSKKLEDH